MTETVQRAWISVCVFLGFVFGVLVALAMVGL
jgi:hypothetical protein